MKRSQVQFDHEEGEFARQIVFHRNDEVDQLLADGQRRLVLAHVVVEQGFVVIIDAMVQILQRFRLVDTLADLDKDEEKIRR